MSRCGMLSHFECSRNLLDNAPTCTAAPGAVRCPHWASSLDECASICHALMRCSSFLFNRYHECYTMDTRDALSKQRLRLRPDHPRHGTHRCIRRSPEQRIAHAWERLAPLHRRNTTRCVPVGRSVKCHPGTTGEGDAPSSDHTDGSPDSPRFLRLLMAVTTGSSPAERRRLERNAVSVSHQSGGAALNAKWLAMVYDSNMVAWQPLARQLQLQSIWLSVANASLLDERPAWISYGLGRYQPKLPMQLRHALPLAREFDAVWLLDSDIAFAAPLPNGPRFRLKHFFRRCSPLFPRRCLMCRRVAGAFPILARLACKLDLRPQSTVVMV